jgi:hypothetical protein
MACSRVKLYSTKLPLAASLWRQTVSAKDVSQWRPWGTLGQPVLYPRFEPGTSPIWNRSSVFEFLTATLKSFAMWRCVGWVVPDVSEALCFRRFGSTTFLRNVGSDLPSDTASHTGSSVLDRCVMNVLIAFSHKVLHYVQHKCKECPDNNDQLWGQPTTNGDIQSAVKRTLCLKVDPIWRARCSIGRGARSEKNIGTYLQKKKR